MTTASANLTTIGQRVEPVAANGPAPKPDLEQVIQDAYTTVAERHATAGAALFDLNFLQRAGAPLVAAFVAGHRSRHDTASALAAAWNADVAPMSSRSYRWQMANSAMIADTFLAELRRSLRKST